jgi:hypothetical protein
VVGGGRGVHRRGESSRGSESPDRTRRGERCPDRNGAGAGTRRRCVSGPHKPPVSNRNCHGLPSSGLENLRSPPWAASAREFQRRGGRLRRVGGLLARRGRRRPPRPTRGGLLSPALSAGGSRAIPPCTRHTLAPRTAHALQRTPSDRCAPQRTAQDLGISGAPLPCATHRSVPLTAHAAQRPPWRHSAVQRTRSPRSTLMRARVISGKDSDRWSRTSAWSPTSPVSWGAAHPQPTLDAHEARIISGKDSDR